MPTVSDPIKIGSMELPNRIAVAPTLVNYSTREGHATAQYVNYLGRLAQGGWGLITVGVHTIERWYGIASNAGSIHDDACIPGLSDVTRAIHECQALCSLQIMASGMQTSMYRELWGEWPGYDPRGVTEGYLHGVFPYRAMSTEECEQEQDNFAKAVVRAKRSGFDAVTLHGASAFLIQQFMSPATNHRPDKYGNRLLWVTELIRKVRAAVGFDYPIIMRACGQEYSPGGYELNWFVKEACPAMVEAGIDALDVTAGTQDMSGVVWVVPSIYEPMGVLMHIPEAVKREVNIPVISVGKINDARMVRRYIEDGRCDIVSVARQALADPDFAKKTLSGKDDEVRKCIYCGFCGSQNVAKLPLLCAVNSEQGRATESRITKTDSPKKIVVIGGGVGGMELAWVADLRGHDVTLIEKNPDLGGMVSVVSRMPNVFVRSLGNSVEWLAGQLRKGRVKVELSTEATAEMVMAKGPDAVVIATGSRPVIPDVPGVDRTNVFTMDDYLKGSAQLGDRVAVLGGGYGAEIAVSIARGNKQVTLITDGGAEVLAASPYMFDYVRNLKLQRFLAEPGIKVIFKAQVKEIDDRGVNYLDKRDREQTAEADTVILAIGRVPNRQLIDALRGEVSKLYEIGDCRQPDKIATAIHDGARIGREI